MLNQIAGLLRRSPGVKARAIAAELGVEKSEVNKLLYANSDRFECDASAQWSLATAPVLRVKLASDNWLHTSGFEAAISRASPLKSASTRVVFEIDCKLMLEALARLLALCNQLVAAGKKVTLDFTGSKPSLTYLDRIGFLELLSQSILVLPQRPTQERAQAFRGNNDGVIEFRRIDTDAPDQEIPRLLQKSFVRLTNESYSVAALTILGELFDNVLEHSGTNSAGFAGLQHYPGGGCIQTVISDNGLGIVGTLMPVLRTRYPEIAVKVAKAHHPEAALLEEVFVAGALSMVQADGRGLGLKTSRVLAGKFSAQISVRQSDFELRISHGPKGVSFKSKRGLALIHGTHVCFDFKLDGSVNAA